jgi:PAP2 superfamily/Vanadium chloroperoxidase N-terminal domain
MTKQPVSFWLCGWVICLGIASSTGQAGPPTKPSDPPNRDSVLDWNAIALEVGKADHSGTFGSPEQGGPTRTSRALAIVHTAMYDAANSVETAGIPYLTILPLPNASLDAAVAQAATDTLISLYPKQKALINDLLARYISTISNKSSFRTRGITIGKLAAQALLHARKNDGSSTDVPYVVGFIPGEHRQDPLNPTQGFLTPGWGKVRPFGVRNINSFLPPPPPSLTSSEYASAYLQVQTLGGDGITTPTARSAEETEIGIYWAYDGAPGLGVPPRLYNQIVRVIAEQEGNSEIENARLFALVNLAMADAGISCWNAKYLYRYWRPILGIREADEGTGPSGLGDGNDDTIGDVTWTPLGAPASNLGGFDFTPPFPAYPSGHATFGAATFRMLENFYGTDNIAFTFVSDELNGVTTDSLGNVRPLSPRSFASFSEAAMENAESRVYLGIHWVFDATAGVENGYDLADAIFATKLRPISTRGR